MARPTVSSLIVRLDEQQDQIAALRSMLATQIDQHNALVKQHEALVARTTRIAGWLDELRPKLTRFGDWARKVNAALFAH